MSIKCAAPTQERRRLFWTTQPDSCGSNTVCGAECGRPGLTLNPTDDCAPSGSCLPPASQPGCEPIVSTQRTFATHDWLRGLIINMLMTDGRETDTACGYRPGSQGGHWTESYMNGGQAGIVGTLLRTIPHTGRIQDSINLIVAYARATLQRLVERGIAISVDVEGIYRGGNRVELNVSVIGRRDGTANVGVSGVRLSNGWVWQDGV